MRQNSQYSLKDAHTVQESCFTSVVKALATVWGPVLLPRFYNF